MSFGFKPNPKAAVELKFRELFGRDLKTQVTGVRLTPVQCRQQGIPCGSRDGMYHAELYAEGELLAATNHRDWRRAYKALKAEVEKLYADGTSLI